LNRETEEGKNSFRESAVCRNYRKKDKKSVLCIFLRSLRLPLVTDLPAMWLNSRPSAGTLVGLPKLNQVLFSWGQPGSVAAVPEPASLVFLLPGLLGMLVAARRAQH